MVVDTTRGIYQGDHVLCESGGCRMPKTESADIALIIVNYCTARLSIGAVESVLERRHGSRNVHVHLVDNNSTGDDVAVLSEAARSWGSRVTLHLENVNHGFGRGNNVVLRRLAEEGRPPKYVFFLNPDALLKTEAIDQLAEFLDGHPKAAIAGCGIDRPKGGASVESAFRFPNLATAFLGSARLPILGRFLHHADIALPANSPVGEVDWVSGAAFMASYQRLKECNFYDPRYFLYFEETDLMLTLRKKGWSIWFCPFARVEHVAGAATGMRADIENQRPRPSYWFQSWTYYHVKNYGIRYARACALAQLSGLATDRIITTILRRKDVLPKRIVRDFLKNALIPLMNGNAVSEI